MGRQFTAMCEQDYEYETDSGCLSCKVHLKDKEDEKEEDQSLNLLPYIGLSELKHKSATLRSVVAEFLGTLLLVLVGCGSCMGGDEDNTNVQIDEQAKIVRISLCFGLTVATLAQTLGHVSGCHVNPAVTLALTTGRKIGMAKAVLDAVVPKEVRGAGGLGMTTINSEVTTGQAVCIEMLISMILVLVVFASAADDNNTPTVKGSPPLAIGLSITTSHMFAVPLTGSSMNPARSLGPAVVLGKYENHWVYWVGPLLGAVIAAILYQLVFRAQVGGKRRKEVRRVNSKKEFCKMNEETKDLTANVLARDVINSRTSNGKELVWIENIDK